MLLAPADGTYVHPVATARLPIVLHEEPFPPIPVSIPSDSGWTKVVRAHNPFLCGPVWAYGCWTKQGRKLEVREDLQAERAWWVLEHERVHMILSDAGLSLTADPEREQAIANAIATNRMLTRLVGQ